MKVLLFNGSTKINGCTYTALNEIATILKTEGIETKILQMGIKPIHDCAGCNFCKNSGNNYCIFKDDMVNKWIDEIKTADGFIFGSPVFYSHPTGQILALLDRLFYAGGKYFYHKPGAAVVSARRAGTSASLDVLNKYFTDACMPIISSTYWNMVHGNTPEQVKQDDEGLQTMRNLAHNFAWLLKCIEAGKETGISIPKMENNNWTNFIR